MLLNFIITFLITLATVCKPFSVKILILNSQFTHFLDFYITIYIVSSLFITLCLFIVSINVGRPTCDTIFSSAFAGAWAGSFVADIEGIFHLKWIIHVLVTVRSVNITFFTYSNLLPFFVCNFGNNVCTNMFDLSN